MRERTSFERTLIHLNKRRNAKVENKNTQTNKTKHRQQYSFTNCRSELKQDKVEEEEGRRRRGKEEEEEDKDNEEDKGWRLPEGARTYSTKD